MIIKSHSKRSEDLVNLVKQTVPYNCSEVITMKVSLQNWISILHISHLILTNFSDSFRSSLETKFIWIG